MAKLIWHNEKEYEIYHAAFKRNHKSACPCCGGTLFNLANRLKRCLIGNRRENIVKIYCSNCGFIFEHVIENFLTEEEKKLLNIK